MRQLKNRLYTVSTLVPHGARVADIGTDHGHLPIYLIQQGIATFCLACDIKEKPLHSARENLRKSGVPSIDTRLGSGLEPVDPEEVDCICICGMGGEIIASILAGASWVRNPRYTLILQPMTSADALRKYLCEMGFSIECEVPCEENRKIYTVIKAVYTGESFTPDEVFCRIGRLDPSNDTARKYIEKQKRIVEELISDRKKAGLETDGYDIVCAELLNVLEKR